MILVVDVGNTNITFGVYHEKELVTTFRMMTKMPKTRKEYEMNLIAAFCEGMVNGYGIDHEYIHKEECRQAATCL